MPPLLFSCFFSNFFSWFGWLKSCTICPDEHFRDFGKCRFFEVPQEPAPKNAEVLKDPQEYKDMYEKCYQLRRSELHFIIARLPKWVLSQGIFLGGTSEGAMTVTRFDDQRYGDLIIGRFINSFSILEMILFMVFDVVFSCFFPRQKQMKQPHQS